MSDGEDPAVPDVRDLLDRTRESLVDLHNDAQRYTGPFDLPEPTEEDVTFLRDIVGRAG